MWSISNVICSRASHAEFRPIPRRVLRGVHRPPDHLQTLSFLEEAQPGDLAFFGDDSGSITHVGVLWEQGRIIHASGRVRVDKIDHHGIFNEEMKRYTHMLKVLKQYL